MGNKIDRRDFLALMGVGGAAAATMSCGQPKDYFEEVWHPWVEPVEGVIPYVPHHFATTSRESGGVGLLAKVVDGRVIKVEGNDEHPVNKGKLSAREQSIVQGLYSGTRIREPFYKGEKTTWREAEAMLAEKLAEAKGKNISALTGQTTGATEALWTRFVSQMGSGKLVPFEPFSDSDMLKASEMVFGQSATPWVSLDGCDTVVSLGAQFLETWGDSTRFAREYAMMRDVHDGHRGIHIQVEAKMSGTGSNADEVHHAKPGSEHMLALALLKAVAAQSSKLTGDEQAMIAGMTSGVTADNAAAAAGLTKKDVDHLVDMLTKAESPVVLPAERYILGDDSVAHNAAVLLLNKALGGIGKHFNYAAGKPITRVPSHKPIADLMSEMNAGSVDVLFIKDANPAYALPNGGFEEAMGKVGFTVAFASNLNETVKLADLVIPVHHDLEAWGEINTYTGVDMLQQPAMQARWTMVQAEERLIDLINGELAEADQLGTFRDFLKRTWLEKTGGTEATWREDLKRGGRFELPAGEDLPISGNLDASLFANASADTQDLAFVIVPSARFGDGECGDRGYLHELPDTMTGVAWDSWLEISKAKADEMSITYGDVLRVEANGQSVEVPAFISETNADNVVTLATGMGHTGYGNRYDRGVNAFNFLSTELNDAEQFSAAPMSVTLTKTGGREKMATFHVPGVGDRLNTQLTLFDEKDPNYTRTIYKSIGLSTLASGKKGGGGHYEVMDMDSQFPMHMEKDMYADRTDTPVSIRLENKTFYDDYKWEMAVDLNRCTGCGACVTACNQENNIPIVGKDQIVKGREMAWIRINRYLDFTEKDGHKKVSVGVLPMMCQQCGSAPCEAVCPSLATYHNQEGLNVMIYNRCVGTRYCANNCSYKVRRYNWFDYGWEDDQHWALNPEVSVRSRGVMEKCTMCAHRLRVAKSDAKDKGPDGKVEDGEVMIACQQACPSHAITFGNYSDTNSEIYKVAHDKRAYRALDSHLHTKPGVSYLKRVTLAEDEHH